jgi:Mn-dependent DtxR family transcriptional regulator
MSIEAMILRAMLRLARRRQAADGEALTARVSGSEAQVRAALRRLDAAGLVERRGDHPPRLTMAGLAVALGLLAAPRAARPARPGRRPSRAA